MRNRVILVVSIVLSVLGVTVSCIGLLMPDFYSRETLNWQTQSLGQDLVDLILAVPALLITGILAFRDNKPATLMWGGALLYLFYTFVIYCFDLHFNRLFIFYCIILGSLFYSLLYFLNLQIKQPAIQTFHKPSVVKITGIYFLVISVLFYFLWLSEVIPSIIKNETPKTLIETGLPTNPVHVIDLAVILPGIFITGMLLLRKKVLGLILAPLLLTFFILMDITIGALIVLMKQKELETDLSIAFVMGLLALFSAVLLYFFLNQENKKAVISVNR